MLPKPTSLFIEHNERCHYKSLPSLPSLQVTVTALIVTKPTVTMVRVARGGAIGPVTNMVVEGAGLAEVESTPYPEEEEWKTMIKTLLGLVDLIASLMVDDKMRPTLLLICYTLHCIYTHCACGICSYL